MTASLAPRAVPHRQWVVGVLVLIGTTVVTHAVHGDDLEYQVKAEFVERFTRFIEWPPAAFANASSPFVVCLEGQSPIGPHLEKLAKERTIKGRKAVFRRVADPKEIEGCHLVFVAPTEAGKLVDILAKTSGHPILTVADSDGFGARGVLVNFYLQGSFVRFEINAAESKKSGLSFSAKLMKLGKTVSAGWP